MNIEFLIRKEFFERIFIGIRKVLRKDVQLENFLLMKEAPLPEATPKLIDFTTAKALSSLKTEM